MERAAWISECGRYRYKLWRRWGIGPAATFIMLNPSTADAEVDDPTIRRCIGFAKREGCGSLNVVNLYAWRATKPNALWKHQACRGSHNDEALSEATDPLVEGPAIAAWGAHWSVVWGADKALRAGLAGRTKRLLCLGKTKDGHPRHPLYVRADAPLIPLF